MTPQVVRNRYSKVLSAGGMRIVPTRETCIHNFVGCSARLQKRQESAIYMGISAVQMTPDHPPDNVSATAVWEAAPVRAIDKRYGREHGHEATLAAGLR
jgi:hypothetical protein